MREQPYDINVQDNWILIGVLEQPYVIQVCSDRWLVEPGNCWGSGACALGAGAWNTRSRTRAMMTWNKFNTLGFKHNFFSANFYKGRERLRGGNFFPIEGGGAGARRREGGGRVCLSVCLFVCVSRKVIRPSFQTVDKTLHLFGQLGFARDGV